MIRFCVADFQVYLTAIGGIVQTFKVIITFVKKRNNFNLAQFYTTSQESRLVSPFYFIFQ